MVVVIRCCSIASNTAAGSKAGRTTIDPPASSIGTKNDEPAWLNGVQTKWRTSSGHCHSDIWICVMLELALKVFITPLGFPVVPPVYARAETSSGLTSG